MDNGIYIIKDQKFNEVLTSLRLIFDLKKENVTKALVLTQILNDRLKKYPSKKKMIQKKDELYGAKLNTRSYSVGKHQIIDISLLGINEKFVDEKLHDNYVLLLQEVLYNPLINEETLKEAKKNVKQQIKRSQENPSTYAFYKALELAGKGQFFGISMLGYEEEIQGITVGDIKIFHKSLLSEAYKELYVVGDVENLWTEDMNPSMDASIQKTNIESGYFSEEHNSSQSEVIQFYQSEIDPDHELYYAYLTMIAYLGQSPTSLLFQNVREKESLCYSIYASQLIYDGVFFIATSIDAENEEKVIDLIKSQFDIIREESIDLTATKKYLKNQFEGLSESTRQRLEFEFRNRRLNKETTYDQLIQSFMNVTEDQVKKVLDYIGSPWTFVYRGVKHEKN